MRLLSLRLQTFAPARNCASTMILSGCRKSLEQSRLENYSNLSPGASALPQAVVNGSFANESPGERTSVETSDHEANFGDTYLDLHDRPWLQSHQWQIRNTNNSREQALIEKGKEQIPQEQWKRIMELLSSTPTQFHLLRSAQPKGYTAWLLERWLCPTHKSCGTFVLEFWWTWEMDGLCESHL